MAESVNPHYDKLISDMNANKDSIFEPCRVMDFNTKTLMATTRGIRSKSIKKNVIALFPSMYMNTGIISFPVKDSVGLIFIGVDGESYLLPAQFFPPVKETQNSSVSSNSSPGQFDELMSLENMEAGEVLLRALSGAQVYVRNNGDIEISNSKMHRISLNELDGSYEMVVEKKREYIGYHESFNGVHESNLSDDSSEHHIYENYFEEVPKWETDEILPDETVRGLLEGNVTGTDSVASPKPIAKKQVVNVYREDDTKKTSLADAAELFYDFELFQKDDGTEPKERFKINLSKEGALQTESISADQNQKVTVTQTNGLFEAKMENTATGVASAIRITADGEVEVTDKRGTYTISSLAARLSALDGNA